MKFTPDFYNYKGSKRACELLLLIYHFFNKQIDFRLQISLICKNEKKQNNSNNIMGVHHSKVLFKKDILE